MSLNQKFGRLAMSDHRPFHLAMVEWAPQVNVLGDFFYD